MHVVVAGGSGFLGSRLRVELGRRGHDVTSLVRRPSSAPHESTWDPYAGEVDADLMARADAVVNLAGSPTIGNPHSKKWAAQHRESRIVTTDVLARAIAAAPTPPAFIAGNGISWYGDHGDAELTEASDSRGHSLFTETSRQWQAAAAPAVDAGARVAYLRTSPVLDRTSAPLRQLSLLFRLGLGGKIGNGRQWMPLISLRDWIGAVAFVIEHPEAAGPVNLSIPEPATNADFTRALAQAVNRPAVVPAPRLPVRLALGPMAPEILGSMRVRPAALLAWGYEFADPTVRDVVETGLELEVTRG